MSDSRHDSGELPVTPTAQAWCDGRYARVGNGDPLAGIIRTKHLISVVAAILTVIGTLGGIAYAQAKAEAKDAKAAVEKAEARLVDAFKDKKADDDKQRAEVKAEVKEQRAAMEQARAEQNVIHRKLDLLLINLEGRFPRGLPAASDFAPAEVPKKP